MRPLGCSLNKIAIIILSIAVLTASAQLAVAQTQPTGNFVYTNDNIYGANTVSGFSVGSTGALTPIGTFPTGGTGSGGGFYAANRATVRVVGNFLYVSDSGSLDIAGFSINPTTGVLTSLGAPIPSGATSNASGYGISLAVTPDNKYLIAGNSYPQTLVVFSIGANGSLTQVSGPTAAGGIVDGMKVSPNGQFLAVALPYNSLLTPPTPSSIAMFSINDSTGALTPVAGSPFLGSGLAAAADCGPAGIDIDSSSTLLFAGECNSTETIVDVYNINPTTGALSPITGSPFAFTTDAGSNSNVVLLSADGTTLFVSNQSSNTVTALSVAPATASVPGSLTPVTGSPVSAGGSDLAPSGEAESQAGTFLYTADFPNYVSVFSIGSGDALTLVGTFYTGQEGGLESLTAFPPTTSTIVGAPAQPGTTQTFDFNTTPGSLDIVSAIIPNVSTLVNVGATPIITAFSVPPTNPSSLWANSPLATATCIPLNSTGGNCAPKLAVCTNTSNPSLPPSGVDCPYDSTGAEDVLLSDQFNPVTPITSLPQGQYPGVVALNDTQGCPFAAPFAALPCPSNGLKSFNGDPSPVHGTSNSFYYYVMGVLAPSTAYGGIVNVSGTNWINGNNPQVTLTATPPPPPASNTNGWYPSPIDYIAYVNLLAPPTAAAPNPNYPLNLQNAQGVVTPGNPLGAVVDFSDNVQSPSTGFVSPEGTSATSTCGSVLGNSGNILPASSSYSFGVPVTLGTLTDQTSYALYWETEDCTRTAERLYNYPNSTTGWTTAYKSVVYTVDDDPPTITITVPANGAIYPANATVASSFSCTDVFKGVAGSGVASCSGPSRINTTPNGSILTPLTFTVNSSDNVGNTANPAVVNYSVSCLYAENTVSPTTFSRGQNFTVTPSVTNCTKSLQSLTVSVVLSGPMGSSCSAKSLTLVNAITVPVPAGVALKATFGPFSVPKNACAGAYTFTTTSSTKGVTDFNYSQTLTVN